MVQFISALILTFSLSAEAQFFGLGGDNKFSSRIPELSKKLGKMSMSTSPGYEESFNKAVKDLENAVEEEKLYCAGEASDSQGKTLAQGQKELCFRELKKHYLEAMDVVFNLKKQYLGLLHTQHMQRLSDIHKKLTSEIEKNF